jgi:hypothetical protein
MDYLEFITRTTSHIPGRGQVIIRYFGLYANAHRSKVRKAEEAAGKLIIIEEESRKIPRRGWAEMIRKVYEVDPLVCPECGGRMKIIAFITDYSVLDPIINHLKLRFIADIPRAPKLSLTSFFVMMYTSSRWLDGRIGTKRLTRPAQPKRNFFLSLKSFKMKGK